MTTWSTFALRDLARDGSDVRRTVDVPALETQVGPARQSLVQETPERYALERQEMEIGEMGDSHGGSWAR